MTDIRHVPLTGDRPLGQGDEDRLGFRELAKRVAQSLAEHVADNGIVIGINGAWGSGKSSLIHLIQDELGKLPDSPPAGRARPAVVAFKPWLVGSRDALIRALFVELDSALAQIALEQGDAAPDTRKKAEKAAKALRDFLVGVSKLGELVEVAGVATSFSPLQLIGRALSAFGGLGKDKEQSISLTKLKDKLVKSLEELGRKIVVTVDDLDRLDPGEVIEVLRLVRSVADFPNVAYLLCYDIEVLAHSVEQAANIKDGRAYLGKIVQLTVMVPQPEVFQLRQWFADELDKFASVKDRDELERLKSVIDYEGGRQLKTPRAVVRALDALKFFWPSLRDAKADLADLVWIQLIKDGNPSLYRWIEEYCLASSAVYVGSAGVEEAEKNKMNKSLLDTSESEYFSNLIYNNFFANNLPGVSVDASNNGNFKLFQEISHIRKSSNLENRRISSPDHFRLYFGLSSVSSAILDCDIRIFIDSLSGGSGAAQRALLNLHGQRFGSLSKADRLFEHIAGMNSAALDSDQARNLLIALSSVMDEIYRMNSLASSAFVSTWSRAEKLIPLLMARISDPEQRAAVIEEMFATGQALGWLTDLFRRETWAHGRYGERDKAQDEWLINDAELDQVTCLMIARYRGMSMPDILSTVRPIDLLFAWQQADCDNEVKDIVRGYVASDEGLIDALEAMLSSADRNDVGRVQILRRSTVDVFMDYDAAAKRVKALEMDSVLGARAKALSVAFRMGDRW